jgi:hypothetical protein
MNEQLSFLDQFTFKVIEPHVPTESVQGSPSGECSFVLPVTEDDGMIDSVVRVIAEDLPPDCEQYLSSLIESRIPLIYLYGMNPHLCFVRTHRSTETFGAVAVMRRVAEEMLKGAGYYHHCWHVSPDRIGGANGYPIRAKVFRLNTSSSKRKEQ